VAQSGSAPALGAGGPGFESRRPDRVTSDPVTGCRLRGSFYLPQGSDGYEGPEPVSARWLGELGGGLKLEREPKRIEIADAGDMAYGRPREPPLRRLRCALGEREGPSGTALTRRKRALHGLVPATTTVVSQVVSIEERGRDLFAAVERLDLEGIVAKRKADPYRPETVWYKSKSRTYT
jgi:hypothetical protein